MNTKWIKRSALLSLLVLMVISAGARAQELRCGESLVVERAIDPVLCRQLRDHLNARPAPAEAEIFERRRHAERIAGELQEVLVSEGHYFARVSTQVRGQAGAYSARWSVTAGPLFKVDEYQVIYEREVEVADALPQPAVPSGVSKSSPRGPDIEIVQKSLLSDLQNTGYPFARLIERTVKARTDAPLATVLFRIDQGRFCRFGKVVIAGHSRVEESHVKAILAIPEGQPCSRAILADARKRLAGTDLFASAEIEPDDTARGPDDRMPVRVSVRERKHRTLALGLSYESNIGPGATLGWEHRNILGSGERLRAELRVHNITQDFQLRFARPFPQRRSKLLGTLGLVHETREAFDSSEATIGLGYERTVLKDWTLTYMAELDYARVESDGTTVSGLELSLPMTMKRAELDDPLNPLSGHRLVARVVPVRTGIGEGASFLRVDLRASHYRILSAKSEIAFGIWGHAGSTLFASLDEVPANRRYYGGGSLSVRAIAFEHLGSLSDMDVPLGGRSIFEGGVELRRRVWRNLGLAAFVEGGRSFAGATPDFEEDLLWGGGLGLRYKTVIGPLRIDIAAPFDARPSDDNYQIYIGLGQAF